MIWMNVPRTGETETKRERGEKQESLLACNDVLENQWKRMNPLPALKRVVHAHWFPSEQSVFAGRMFPLHCSDTRRIPDWYIVRQSLSHSAP